MRQNRSHSSGLIKGSWLYGFHVVNAALANPRRKKLRLIIKDEKILTSLAKLPDNLHPEIVDKIVFQAYLGGEAVHQGVALLTMPLTQPHIEEFVDELPTDCIVTILDGVTDPHNIGAIVRTAAAFGGQAVIMTDHHAPPDGNSILAKTASGALDCIPLIRVTNLVRSLKFLQEHGFWIYGLDEHGQMASTASNLSGRIAFIFGAEGEGLKRLTRETCDGLISLPTIPEFSTLNVSTSVAVALYEWRRQQLAAKS